MLQMYSTNFTFLISPQNVISSPKYFQYHNLKQFSMLKYLKIIMSEKQKSPIFLLSKIREVHKYQNFKKYPTNLLDEQNKYIHT